MGFQGIDVNQARHAVQLARKAADEDVTDALDILGHIEGLVGMSDWTTPIRGDLHALRNQAQEHAATLDDATTRISALDTWDGVTSNRDLAVRPVGRSGIGGRTTKPAGRLNDWALEDLLSALDGEPVLGPPNARPGGERPMPSRDDLLAELQRRWQDPALRPRLVLFFIRNGVPEVLQDLVAATSWDDVDVDPKIAEALIIAIAESGRVPPELQELADRLANQYEDVLYAGRNSHQDPDDLTGMGLDLPFTLDGDIVDAFLNTFDDDRREYVDGALHYKWTQLVPDYTDPMVLVELDHLESRIPDPPEGGWQAATEWPSFGDGDQDERWVHRFSTIAGEVNKRSIDSEDFRRLLDEEWDDQRLVDMSDYTNYLINQSFGLFNGVDTIGLPTTDTAGRDSDDLWRMTIDATGMLLASQLRSTQIDDDILNHVGSQSPLMGYALAPHTESLIADDQDRGLYGQDNMVTLTRSVWTAERPEGLAPNGQHDPNYIDDDHLWVDARHTWLAMLQHHPDAAYQVMVDGDGELTDAAHNILKDQTWSTGGPSYGLDVETAGPYFDIVEDFTTSALRHPRTYEVHPPAVDPDLAESGTRLFAAISAMAGDDELSLGAQRAAANALDIYLPLILADPDGTLNEIDELDGGTVTIVNGDGEHVEIDLQGFTGLLGVTLADPETHQVVWDARQSFARHLAENAIVNGAEPTDFGFEQLTHLTRHLDASVKHTDTIEAIEELVGLIAGDLTDVPPEEWANRIASLIPYVNDGVKALDMLGWFRSNTPEEEAARMLRNLPIDDVLPRYMYDDHDEQPLRDAAVISAIPNDAETLEQLGLADIPPHILRDAQDLADTYLTTDDPTARKKAGDDLNRLLRHPEDVVITVMDDTRGILPIDVPTYTTDEQEGLDTLWAFVTKLGHEPETGT